MEREKYIYIIHILYVCIGIPTKTLCFINRLNSLKHVNHFSAYNSNQKTEKEKRKKKILSL